MDRLPVQSSHITSIGHDGNILEVEYASGNVWRYSGVAKEDFDSVMLGESIGRSLKQVIRKDGVVGTRFVPDIIEPA